MLNERNKANKEAKNAAMKERGIKRQFAGSFKPVDGDHPHGTHGEERGARKKPARKVGPIVMKGRTGTTATDTQDPRLVGRKGKRKRSAKEILKNYSAGPVGKLPDHTVYHDMGYLMAESLGLVSEGRFDYMQDTPEGEAKTKKAQKDAAVAQRKANAKKIKAARGGAVTTTPRSGNPESIDYPPGGRP